MPILWRRGVGRRPYYVVRSRRRQNERYYMDEVSLVDQKEMHDRNERQYFCWIAHSQPRKTSLVEALSLPRYIPNGY